MPARNGFFVYGADLMLNLYAGLVLFFETS